MSPFDGHWRITWMQAWDEEFIDLVQPGYFLFDKDLGSFAFGAVSAAIDARVADGGRRIDFSWDGMDEGDAVSGRGWFVLKNQNTAEGRLFIHMGDDSEIRIERPE